MQAGDFNAHFIITFIFLCILIMGGGKGYAENIYSFDSNKQEAQFNYLLKDLRCLVCQNQDLSDSHAPLAKDLRDVVYRLVKEGKSDDEITKYLTMRYGDYILFKPPLKPLTMFLWLGPFLFLSIGFFVYWRCTVKRADHA